MPTTSEIVFDMAPANVKEMNLDTFVKENPECKLENLSTLGITVDKAVMDAAPSLITTPSNVTPIQFAQFWLTEAIRILTRGRSLDKVIGRTIVGDWAVEQIVATIMERIGQPALYGDLTKAPLANWNVNFETRDNVRFEMGISNFKLEEARASQMRINSRQEKMDAMSEAFAILMNNIGWWGYNSNSKNFVGTSKKVYGILNDPGLLPATNLGGSWIDSGSTTVTMDDIVTDIIGIVTNTVTNLKGNYDPETDSATLALPINQYNQLGKINQMGVSVRDWLSKTYPKIRIVSCAELVGASGSAAAPVDMALFIVDSVIGKSSVQQLVTSALRLVGVQPMAKGTYEVYSCSTAGTLVKYPLAVATYTFA